MIWGRDCWDCLIPAPATAVVVAVVAVVSMAAAMAALTPMLRMVARTETAMVDFMFADMVDDSLSYGQVFVCVCLDVDETEMLEERQRELMLLW